MESEGVWCCSGCSVSVLSQPLRGTPQAPALQCRAALWLLPGLILAFLAVCCTWPWFYFLSNPSSCPRLQGGWTGGCGCSVPAGSWLGLRGTAMWPRASTAALRLTLRPGKTNSSLGSRRSAEGKRNPAGGSARRGSAKLQGSRARKARTVNMGHQIRTILRYSQNP